jgi:two-component system sensor histidine kinase/response regulator
MARLQQEHKMRDDFVATLTHDLKVPLLAEKQTLAYMRNQTYGPVCEEQAEVLDSLQSSNRSCLSLVTGLLEVYRYDSGEVALLFDSFDMVSLLMEIVNEFQALAREKLISMDVESTLVESQEEALVYADRLEIKRVLGNLISNAIMNTPKHGAIRCKITNAQHYGVDTIYKVSSFQHTSLKFPVKLAERLMITVQDSGLGFSQQDLASLFKQFAANKSRNPMSIGLGLYNCYQVLKAHKGVVWVESTEGEGSLVSFILPQNRQAAQDRRIFRDRRRYPEN